MSVLQNTFLKNFPKLQENIYGGTLHLNKKPLGECYHDLSFP